MNLAESVWEHALPILRDELSTATYCSYIEDLKVVDIKDRLLILETDEEFVKKMLTDRYAPAIENALYQVGGRDYKIKVILSGEIEETQKSGEDDAASFINPKYTFDSFIIGSSNKFAHAAAVAWPRTPESATTPSSSTETWVWERLTCCTRLATPSRRASRLQTSCTSPAKSSPTS